MTTTSHFRLSIRPLVAALGVAGLAAFSLAGCGPSNSQAAPQAAAPAGPPVTASAVVERSVDETQEFSGRLEAVERVDIRARVGGFITSVNFKPGSLVNKGDVLFVIDTRPFQAEANRAESAAVSARSKADLARLELARSEKLVADKAIAQRELDTAASNLKQLDADAKAAQASLETARLNLAYTKVTAPISGRVSKAEITAGNLVDASAILTTVISTKNIYATFDGDEATYLRVSKQAHAGQPVAVNVGLVGEEGFPHEGKLEFVDNQLDARTGSVRMRATFENTDGSMAPGLFARVQISGGKPANALLITDRAVGTDQSRKFVYVVDKDGKAEYRAVTLGPVVDGLRVVRSGLKAGEKIVVNGLQRVRPGAPITAQTVPMVASLTGPAKDGAKIAMADTK
ncbi:efflux RND transporter periplasmic adaptor subunit [Massilia sp. S19_KUP03_FR1]|uniref:efflux RND transporter periplasmic adaptor subunit n=1 Tax=Massilia sp. S19_KUP03_FR1 TaxID=3025503 RepID=UPI002FCD0152